MPNYCVIICSAFDANATASNILLSYPLIISVDKRDKSYDAKIKPVIQRASMWCKRDRNRPFVINWCICCIIILRADLDHNSWSLSHQPPLPIYPWERILLLLPRIFISVPPPFKFDWCQGTAHCTHETCQARIIQPTPTSPTSTSIHGSICTDSHTTMSLLPNSRWLEKICVCRISSSLSSTTSRLCLGMKILL